jgi:hypothetical protein
MACSCRRRAFDKRDTGLLAAYPELAAPHLMIENLSLAILKNAHVRVFQALLHAHPLGIQGALDTAEIWKCFWIAFRPDVNIADL